MTDAVEFSEMTAHRPEYEELRATFEAIGQAFEAADDTEQRVEAVRQWDQARRRYRTWRSLTRLYFHQDTRDEKAREELDYSDELEAHYADLEIGMKRRVLARREELEPILGRHAFALWESDVTTFEPAIQDDLVRESKLEAAYTELCASAEITVDGETFNLSGIRKFFSEADRALRHRAQRALWEWFSHNGEAFDEIYDELVTLRDRMARKLEYPDYVELGYRRMQRVDYDRQDVETFRAQVVEHVVPLATAIREEQARQLGVDRLMFWDEKVFDPRGNPRPRPQQDALTDAAREMFDNMRPELGSFFGMMTERNLLDLETREGKAGGGFCTSFDDYGVPFVFANFTGTKDDVEVFTHEMGHAFQAYCSRDKFPVDFVWPTMESCEIHSMSLEFLCWPQMELFFGEDAARFRRNHLVDSLLFLPYGCAVDHFQHRVYENPDATPEQRHAMWREMEELYLPWRDWGDLEYGAKGGRWQYQSHIYIGPFYYIDYVLALTCALQFWDRMQADYPAAMQDYVALCQRGGEAPFLDLVASAGLTSPFEEGCLVDVVARASDWLNLN